MRARSSPSSSIRPALLGASPMMARKVVVLPTPLRPSRAAHSPAFTFRFTPCKMCSRPTWTCTSSSLSMDGLLDEVLVLLAAEIGLAHALVGGDLGGAAGSKHPPLPHHPALPPAPQHPLPAR